MNDASPNSPDRIDRLLGDFFRNEMPQPWPAPRRIVTTVHVGNAAMRSRVALAASVVALFGLGVYLSSATPAHAPKVATSERLLSGSTANGEELLKKAQAVPVAPTVP